MSSRDYYSVERERAAEEHALSAERKRQEVQSAAKRDSVDQIANDELRQIGIRAYAQLTAAGVGPARLFREANGFFTGKTGVRRAFDLGSYWLVGIWGQTAVLVNESGIFGGFLARFRTDRKAGELDVVLTRALRPLAVHQVFESKYSSDDSPMSLDRDEQGLPMFLGSPLESRVARDVVKRIGAPGS